MNTEMDHILLSELQSEREQHDRHSFHAPNALDISGPGLQSVLIIGSCQANAWGFHRQNSTHSKVDVVLTNNVSTLEDRTNEDLRQYDLQIVQVPLRSLLPDASVWRLDYSDVQGHQEVFDASIQRLRLFLKQFMKYNVQTGLLTFVSNFFTPQHNPMGRLLPKFDIRNPEYQTMRMNEELEKALADYKNAYVLDVDRITAIYGKKYIQEDSIGWFSHGSTLPAPGWDRTRIEHTPPMSLHHELKLNEYNASVWLEILAMFKTARQRDQVKLVVVDLDDTLWKGVVGEMDAVDGGIVEGWPLGLTEALAYLKRRGIMLAIISKNDECRIRNIFPKVFRERLTLDDFAMVKINYDPKTLNLAEILSKVNVLPSSVVYIDDNPVERASLKAAYPDLRILSRSHYYWRRTLLWAAETQVRTISTESARRTGMMQAQITRDALKQEMSREDFLRTLNLKLRLFEISTPDHPSFARVLELLNKTNQFNTTGVRWSDEQLCVALDRGSRILAFEVTDNFTDYGLVGVIIVSGSTIEQMVMSCRTVGLEVEIAAIKYVITLMRRAGVGTIRARLIHTEANLLCRDLWMRCGMVENDDLFQLASDHTVATPAHVTMEW